MNTKSTNTCNTSLTRSAYSQHYSGRVSIVKLQVLGPIRQDGRTYHVTNLRQIGREGGLRLKYPRWWKVRLQRLSLKKENMVVSHYLHYNIIVCIIIVCYGTQHIAYGTMVVMSRVVCYNFSKGSVVNYMYML